MVEDEFQITLIAHRERPVASLNIKVQEERSALHDDINLDQSLSLVLLGQLHMHGSDISDVKWRRPLVVYSREAEAELLLRNLAQKVKREKLATLYGQNVRRARFTDHEVFAQFVLENETR